MNHKKYQFLAQKDHHQIKFNNFIRRRASTSKDRYRNSIAVDSRHYKPQTQRVSNQKRFSMNINSKAPNIKAKQANQSSHKMQNIKNTLSFIQSRINNAKQELNSNHILGKSIIYQQSQQSKLNQSNSLSSAQHCRPNQSEQKKYFTIKKPSVNRLIQMAELTKIKSYYKSSLAKILLSKDEQLARYFSQFWRSVKNLSNIQQTTVNAMIQLPQMAMNKRILVLGLDQTIIFCSYERKSLQNIDIIVSQSQGGSNKEIYISIRPYSISFLKKMSKKYFLVIHSVRNKKDTDSILDEIDPMGQFIQYRLYNHNCLQYPSLCIKDLRLLRGDLSQVILVDNTASVYLSCIDNLIPILPYEGQNDNQLYSLQKYLQELNKAKDIRLYNSNYFQLKKYAFFEDGIEALKNIYFSHHS